jgi:hypothetical protein
MEHILENEKARTLSSHKAYRRKGDLVRRHSEVTADRVEEVNEGEFAGKVGDKDDFGAFPNLGGGYCFVLGMSSETRVEVSRKELTSCNFH